MKKSLVSLLVVASMAGMVGCKKNSYEIAIVTDVGSLMDGGFNQGTYEGAKEYAEANKLTYKYYQPANGSTATTKDRVAAYNLAVTGGAKVVVAPGFMQADAMAEVAEKNPTVKFLFVDGYTLSDSSKKVLSNVTAIQYKEQEAGYFAGYSAAMDGFKKLGGVFGGGGSNPACDRYAYGYVQGIEDGAKDKGVTDKLEVKVSFKYGDAFSASTELQQQVNGWYNAGTEVVFSCGGSMVNSVVAAVGSNTDRYIIGVDVDQKALSKQVVTSAMKGLGVSVKEVLTGYYAGKWDADYAGKAVNLGAAEDATGLPTADASWRFKNFKKEQYNTLFAKVKAGTVVPKSDIDKDCNVATFWSTKCADMTHVSVILDK